METDQRNTAGVLPAIVPAQSGPALSWAAVIGGGVTAAAASVLLLLLGSGLGLSTVSPWPNSGATAAAVGIGTAIWLVVVQWIASGLGGYLAGRLRTKWTGLHSDEVFFRDTAHGFLAWAVATLFASTLLFSAASSVLGTATQATATVAAGVGQTVVQNATNGSSTDYFVDTLLRAPTNPAGTGNTDVRGEATRILVASIANGEIAPADREYLSQVIAARAGISEADASRRVDDVVAKLKAAEVKTREAADVARKAAATTSILGALALLIGAFIASAAAALGGQHRDD